MIFSSLDLRTKPQIQRILFFGILHLIFFILPVQGYAFQLTPEEQQWLATHESIKFGFADNLEPFAILEPDGAVAGMAPEMLQLLAERLHTTITLELAPWPTILKKAKNRDIDAIAGIMPSHGKAFDLDTSIGLQFNSTPTAFISKNSTIKINKKEDLGGHRLVVLKEMKYLEEFLQPLGDTVSVQKVDTNEEAFSLILRNEADIFLGLTLDNYTLTKRFIVGIKPAMIFWDTTFYIAMGVRNDDPILLSILKKAYSSITDEEILTIQGRWLNMPMIPPLSTLTEQEKRFIKQHPTIQVGIDLNYAPFEFMDDEKGHQGISHDILAIITKKTGLEFSPNPHWNIEALHRQVLSGRIDMLSTQIKSQRSDTNLIYSDALMRVPLVILARHGIDFVTGIDNIQDQRIGVVHNYYPEEYLKTHYPDTSIVPYHTLQDGLSGLSEGHCDFFLESLPQANHIIRSTHITNINPVGKTKQEFDFCFAIRKDLPELQSILNKALATIPMEQKLQIQQKLTNLTVLRHTDWRPIIQIATGAMIIIIIMLIWNRRLQQEIKARKNAESSLQLAQLTLDQIPLHLFWYNDQFGIVMANKAAIKLTGLSLKELRKLHAWDIDPSFDKEQSTEAWSKVKAGHSIDYLGELKCHDGSIIPTEESLTYLQPEAGRAYIVSIGADISTRKQEEQQRRENKIKLKEALIKANESSRLKSEFLSNMSHEIRTPLNAIIGYSEMLEQGDLPADQKRYVQTIINSGQTLIALINDILDLSKLEAGKMQIIPIAINPKAFFAHIIGIFETKLFEKNLRHSLLLDPDLPEVLLLDEVRLRQILFNIIGNAIKFTEEGSIDITVKFEQTADTLGTITITITDTGIGIDKEDQRLIFESFQQKSGGISRQYDGAGLGLTISARFIELMQGELKLQSTPNKGSSFSIILPNTPIQHNTPPLQDTSSDGDLSTLPEATLLITDDIKTNQELIQAFLQDTPLNIITATNGKEALDMVEKHKPDLIFMDIKMGVMGGIEAATLLRANPQTASIPILGLSGSEPSKEELELFDDFLQKPFSLQAIRQKTKQFLQKQGTEEPSPSSLPTEKTPPPLNKVELKNMISLIDKAKSTGNLKDYQMVGQKIQKYAERHSNQTLKTLGTELLNSAKQGAIIQIEDQVLHLEKYLQESP